MGGIYFDTDVLMVAPIDDLLDNRAFVGYENDTHPFTAVFGAEKGHPFVKDILDYYNTATTSFTFDNNNTLSVSNLLVNKYHCKLGNIEQMLPTGIKVYTSDVLCNPSLSSRTIHVFTGTWLNTNKKLKKKINDFVKVRLTTKNRIKKYLFLKRKKLI